MSEGGASSQREAESATLSQDSAFAAARLPAFDSPMQQSKHDSDGRSASPKSPESTQQVNVASDSPFEEPPEAISSAHMSQGTQQSIEPRMTVGISPVIGSVPLGDHASDLDDGERGSQQGGPMRSRGNSDGSAVSLFTALATQEQPVSTQSSYIPSRPVPRARPSTEIVRARWQPDAEVTYCPICHTQFGWVFRKHHCRKCGRVVCGSCSQHRITIPYEYIARPPTYSADQDFLALERYRTGGERVRLCNPCVPDPNIAPPQVPSSQEPLHRRASERSHGSVSGSTTGSASNRRENRSSMFVEHYSNRPRQPSVVGLPANQDGNRSRSSTMPAREANSMNNNIPVNIRRMEPRNAQINHRNFMSADPSSSEPNFRHLLHDNSRPLPNLPRPTEDDICPVCHKLLPARSLPDFEEQRAMHISSCIEAHTTSNYASRNRPEAYTSNSHPTSIPSSSSMPGNSRSQPRRTPTSPVVIPSSSRAPQITPNTPEARMAAREQAHAAVVLGASQTTPIDPGRQTRLFPYKATEKDCVDDAECTICLEEFEVGADMARLECFCRFHLHCIRGWWVDHHGRCPVHQHDGFGF